MEQFHQTKNDFIDEFNKFKTKLLHEVKSFEDNILDTTHKNTWNQEHIVTLLLDNNTFQKDQPQKRQSYRFINQSIFTTKLSLPKKKYR